jgi:hypothetical protein
MALTFDSRLFAAHMVISRVVDHHTSYKDLGKKLKINTDLLIAFEYQAKETLHEEIEIICEWMNVSTSKYYYDAELGLRTNTDLNEMNKELLSKNQSKKPFPYIITIVVIVIISLISHC